MTDTSGYTGAQTVNSASSELNLWDFIVRQILGKSATAQLVLVLDVHAPATIDGTGTVDVQPMVNQIDGAGNPTPHGTIFALPYFRLQGGTNAVIIDPKKGDIGVAVMCLSDISTVKATRKVANPGSRRTFAWSDGLYIGGFLNQIPRQYIQFTDTGINVVAGTIAMTGTPAEDGSPTPTAVTIFGTLAVDGDVTGTGAATFDGSVTGNGIVLDTHVHGGVTTGSGDTGGPV